MAEEGFKRRLTAILSADVIGYSRLMRDDEEATVRDLAAHRVLITEIIQQHNGRVVDSPGDNILAEFASVVDAVNGAIKIQAEIKKSNTGVPEDRRMEFRIGVNLGDVIEEEERIYGDGVNIAARVEGLAAGGGIAISGTVYEHIKEKLTLGYHYLGEQEVKNISEPVRVYRLLTEPTDAGKLIDEKQPKSNKLKWAASAAIALIALVIGAFAIWNYYFRPSFEPASVEKMAFPLPEKPSIAVLAFDNLSGDPEQEYFSDGLTEEIITALSKSTQIFVIARNSSFTYKGKPVKVQQVAEELGVRYVLEGSVRKDKEQVRITAQLIDALKGNHLWAERYDRDLKDIFAIQDEITKQIIAALHVKLTIGEDSLVIARGTNSLEAYLKYLQAREYHMRMTKEDNHNSRRLVEEVISIDPEYGNAYALLGATHMLDVWLQATDYPKQSIGKAIELERKAITLGVNAHHVLGYIYSMIGQHDKAIVECEQAIELDPNSATARMFYGLVLNKNGRFEEAVHELEQALRLDPFSSSATLRSLGTAYCNAGRFKDAISVSKKAIKTAPNDLIARIVLIQAYRLAGWQDEAQKEAAEVLRINPKFSLKLFEKRLSYKNQADTDRWITTLRKAGLPDHPALKLPDKPSIAVLPFDNMSKDAEQEYFADGMTDDLITDLSKISGLFVIARNSTFQYKGKVVDVKKVSRELGIRYVLEGSVRKAGDKVRINAQLIDATTGGHLWAERYDERLEDIFSLQDKITQKIVEALAVKLTGVEQEQITRKDTDNIAAYDAFLKGWGHYLRRTPEDFAKARSYFKKAIELDPNYGQAYAALARVYWSCSENWDREYTDVHKTLRVSWYGARTRAREYLEIAMKRPTSIAYTLAVEMNLFRRLHKKAIVEAERAIAISPNESDSHTTMAKALIFAGRPKEALDSIERAMRLDPHNIAYPLYLRGLSQFSMGQLKEAVSSIERALTHNPELNRGSGVLAAAYAHLGRDQEARDGLVNYMKGVQSWWVALKDVMLLWPFKDSRVAERFADGLLKAGLPGEPSGFYKIYEENHLTGEEIKELVFGRTWRGIFGHQGEIRIDLTMDGKATYHNVSGSYWDPDDKGKSWIAGDMFCSQWETHILLEQCLTVFRNPKGTKKLKNEYFAISDSWFTTFSVEE